LPLAVASAPSVWGCPRLTKPTTASRLTFISYPAARARSRHASTSALSDTAAAMESASSRANRFTTSSIGRLPPFLRRAYAHRIGHTSDRCPNCANRLGPSAAADVAPPGRLSEHQRESSSGGRIYWENRDDSIDPLGFCQGQNPISCAFSVTWADDKGSVYGRAGPETADSFLAQNYARLP